MCNVFLKGERERERRGGAAWSGVTFAGSGEKESCDRQPEAKTRGKKRGKRGGWWGWSGWRGGPVAERVSLGLLVPSVITSISHSLSFQSSLRSELMWAEICLSLWPGNRLRISARTKAGSCVLNPIHHPQSSAFNSSKLKVGGGERSAEPKCFCFISALGSPAHHLRISVASVFFRKKNPL